HNHLRGRWKIGCFQQEVWRALYQAGGRMRMAPLAKELMISRSGATRLIGKLEDKDGWVVRVNTPEDRRATWAELTKTGQEALAAARPVVEAVVSTFLADHAQDEDLRRASQILGVRARANPNAP